MMKLFNTVFFILIITSYSFSQKTVKDLRNSGLQKHIKGDFVGAIKDFNIAIKLNPKDGFTHKIKGRSQNELGLWLDAIKSFTLALIYAPVNHKDVFFIGETYYLRGIARL